MPIQLDRVVDSRSFASQVDVVVIGGGIIGVCTAYELARKGLSVSLIEKGCIGGEQSGRNWGWVRQQNRDLSELPLAMYSVQRWAEIGPEIAADVGFRRQGITYGTVNPADLERWENWGQRAREHGFISHMISGSQVNNRLPGSKSRWLGGVWSPDDGRAEPAQAAPAIAGGAQAIGVEIHQNCAARGLDIVNRKIAGVWTERGLIKTSAVVCAGGAWNSRFCRHHGVELPVANIVGTAMSTSIAPEIVSGCLNTPTFALRRRNDGTYTLAVPGHGRMELAPQGLRYATKFYEMYRAKVAKKLKIRIGKSFFNGPEAWGGWEVDEISPFEKIRTLNPAPDKEMIKLAISNLLTEFPAFADVKVTNAWAGVIDTTPDIVPIISKTPDLDGLTIASGFSGHGFGIGPGAARLTSEIVTGEEPFVDPAPYRLSRFSDGSSIRRPEMM